MTRLPLMIALGLPLALPLALGACAVGPEYAGPPKVVGPKSGDAAFTRGAKVAEQGPVLARWWEVLGDAQLNALVVDALAHSPSVEDAQARVREAGAVLNQKKASDLPSVSPTLIAAKADLPPFTAGGKRSSLEIYNLGATASWEPDFWGINKRTNENARAGVDRAKAQLADAQVSLSAQVAQAYVNLRDAQNRAAMVAQVVALREQALDLVRQRHGAGVATLADVARYEGDMRSAMAQAAPVRAQIEVALNQLAVLTGKAPGDLDAALAQAAPLPVLPARVAVGDPAELLARRPDVRAAERLLAGNTAQVGVARAKLRPRLSFTGILGMGSSSISSIVDPATAAYGILPQLKWTGLDWGKGQASVVQAKAERDSAEAQYRRAVLNALEDAESSLSRFGAARERLMQLEAGEGTARTNARLGAQRVSAGTSSKLEQTEREAQLLNAAITSAQGRAEVVVDYIAIAKALGLGWEG